MTILSVSNAIHDLQKPATVNYSLRLAVVLFGMLAIVNAIFWS